MVNTPLKKWVGVGLSVRDYALIAPSWLDSSRFDLNARLPIGEPVNQNTIAEMMKALLIERLGLKWHDKVKKVFGYELVTDKKISITPPGLLERLKGHGSSAGPGLIGGTNIPMSEFAEALEKALGRPVVNETHLSRTYNIRLRWPLSGDAALAAQRSYGNQNGVDVNNLPSSIFIAVREQLGLRLRSAKVPLKLIVVDHINRQPTEN